MELDMKVDMEGGGASKCQKLVNWDQNGLNIELEFVFLSTDTRGIT